MAEPKSRKKPAASPNPWDPLPISPEGDTEPAPIYTAVGMALSAWEGTELSFATVLMRIFRQPGAFRVYGAVLGTARFDVLRAASEVHFGPDSTEHERLEKIVETASKYGARRNEIAHGRVSRIADKSIPAVGYYLLPSMFSKKTRLSGLQPKYAYTARDIMEFERRFTGFAIEFDRLVEELFQAQKQP